MDKKYLPDIYRTIRIEADINKVWNAVSTAEGLTGWLMPCTLTAKLGSSFTFKAKPMGKWDGTVNCIVKELDPPNKIGFSWSGNGMEHYVSFQLKSEEDGTNLILVHSGWYEGTEQFRDNMYLGWGHLLEGLQDKSKKDGDISGEKTTGE